MEQARKDGVYDLLLSALQKYSDRDYTGSADALLDIDSKKLTTKNMKTIYKDLTQQKYIQVQQLDYIAKERMHTGQKTTRQRSLI